MKPQSCKAKGRRFQQQVVSDLLETFPELQEDDIRSTSMGCNGEDCQLSPAAREKIPCSIECKNVERLNIWSTIEQSTSNAGQHHPMIVIKKNKTSPWAAVPWTFFLQLLRHRYDVQTSSQAPPHSTLGKRKLEEDVKDNVDDFDRMKRIKYHITQLHNLMESED